MSLDPSVLSFLSFIKWSYALPLTDCCVFKNAWDSVRQHRNTEVVPSITLTLHFYQADHSLLSLSTFTVAKNCCYNLPSTPRVDCFLLPPLTPDTGIKVTAARKCAGRIPNFHSFNLSSFFLPLRYIRSDSSLYILRLA